MKKKSILLIGAIGLATGLSAIAYYASVPPDPSSPSAGISRSELDVRLKMRDLWDDHVAWSRMYLIAAAADAPDVQETEKRLLKNQSDLGDVLAIFYGKPVGRKLTALLTEHILIAGKIIQYRQLGNQAAQQAEETKWTRNGGEIAGVMAAANPYWLKADLDRMMAEHLRLNGEHMAARLNKQYANDFAVYHQIRQQALKMADHWSEGIIKQFPEKFTMESLSSCN